jgi:hypothetical protein
MGFPLSTARTFSAKAGATLAAAGHDLDETLVRVISFEPGFTVRVNRGDRARELPVNVG